MNAQPNFDEALRRQREVFADRYAGNPDLQRYVAEAFGDNDREELTHGD